MLSNAATDMHLKESLTRTLEILWVVWWTWRKEPTDPLRFLVFTFKNLSPPICSFAFSQVTMIYILPFSLRSVPLVIFSSLNLLFTVTEIQQFPVKRPDSFETAVEISFWLHLPVKPFVVHCLLSSCTLSSVPCRSVSKCYSSTELSCTVLYFLRCSNVIFVPSSLCTMAQPCKNYQHAVLHGQVSDKVLELTAKHWPHCRPPSTQPFVTATTGILASF